MKLATSERDASEIVGVVADPRNGNASSFGYRSIRRGAPTVTRGITSSSLKQHPEDGRNTSRVNQSDVTAISIRVAEG